MPVYGSVAAWKLCPNEVALLTSGLLVPISLMLHGFACTVNSASLNNFGILAACLWWLPDRWMSTKSALFGLFAADQVPDAQELREPTRGRRVTRKLCIASEQENVLLGVRENLCQ